MLLVRRTVAALLWAIALTPALSAQPSGVPEELVLHAYTFKHQPAAQALELIHPLLSKRGTVELQRVDNTVVVRDVPAAIKRIAPVLLAYDHPPQPLGLEIIIVRASHAAGATPTPRSGLPESMTRRLRAVLQYDNYDIQARAYLSTTEGQAVTYGMGKEFEVAFRLGTLIDTRRIRLSDFQVSRRMPTGGARPLIQTTVNLWLEQPMSLGFARNEASSEALLVVLTLHNGDARRPAAH